MKDCVRYLLDKLLPLLLVRQDLARFPVGLRSRRNESGRLPAAQRAGLVEHQLRDRGLHQAPARLAHAAEQVLGFFDLHGFSHNFDRREVVAAVEPREQLQLGEEVVSFARDEFEQESGVLKGALRRLFVDLVDIDDVLAQLLRFHSQGLRRLMSGEYRSLAILPSRSTRAAGSRSAISRVSGKASSDSAP